MSKKTNYIFGVRAVIEAINAGKDLEKVIIQRGVNSSLVRELHKLLNKLAPALRLMFSEDEIVDLYKPFFNEEAYNFLKKEYKNINFILGDAIKGRRLFDKSNQFEYKGFIVSIGMNWRISDFYMGASSLFISNSENESIGGIFINRNSKRYSVNPLTGFYPSKEKFLKTYENSKIKEWLNVE